MALMTLAELRQLVKLTQDLSENTPVLVSQDPAPEWAQTLMNTFVVETRYQAPDVPVEAIVLKGDRESFADDPELFT